MKARSNVYLLGFIVTLCLVVIDSAAYSNYRTRPRATRGFKNAALSTARGFGKRNSYLGSSDTFFDLPIDFKKTTHEDFLKEFPSDSGRFSIEWFIKELSKNPRLARIINKKIIEKNRADESSSEENLQSIDY